MFTCCRVNRLSCSTYSWEPAKWNSFYLGGTSGVGTIAIQLAKNIGAEILQQSFRLQNGTPKQVLIIYLMSVRPAD
jgi:D-arabinose 1-dehydrogenase-like Zn-dependent alcohol dehydrogenase